MGQSSSSDLRLDPPPPLAWFRVRRLSSNGLQADWHWTAPVSSSHLLLVPSSTMPVAADLDSNSEEKSGSSGTSSSSSSSSATTAEQPVLSLKPARRVRLSPGVESYSVSSLQSDTAYRVCLQFTTEPSLAASSGSSFKNSTQIHSRQASPAVRPAESMYCLDATTKQTHISASVGSCIGAVSALILVLTLVLLSRRTKRYRKMNERQTSSKRVAQESALLQQQQQQQAAAAAAAAAAATAAASSDDKKFTQQPQPPPPPPPPPPLATPSICELESSDTAATASTPPASSLILNHTEAANTCSTINGRQVIQVNETDEYSIDLKHCESLSRQQSLRAATSAAATSITAKEVDDASEDVSLQFGEAASDVMEKENLRRGSESRTATAALLYTQLIETL